MQDLTELREDLQKEITSCISGYIGFITHPLRERLTKDVCQRVIDRIDKSIISEEHT